MSDVIQLLPDSVANQIAAGEVIQRPASVIKELVENSIDAGATQIKIILKDAGKTLIQVVDDGCGMSDTDARLAFERHATSKIRQASDLFELHTMGFRGEALPSIAAVAQIDLRTMRRDQQIGTHLELAASKFVSQSPDACNPGSNLAVKNLFFNFPARRKFLKKDAVELGHIIREFERLALVNPNVEFELYHNDVNLYQLLPGTLKERITGLFGKGMDKQLIPVATETPLVKISGFISLPEYARKRNAQQFFFVNGRNMRHPYFHKAVMSCFEELISSEHQPNYFLNFEVDPQTIDVNIHPTKSEIKFENEQPIWQILTAAIRESLGKYNAVGSLDFNKDDAPEIPVFNPDAAGGFSIPADTGYNPFEQDRRRSPAPSAINTGMSGGGSSLRSSSKLNDWDKLYEDFNRDISTPAPSKESSLGGFIIDETQAGSTIGESRLNSLPQMEENQHSGGILQLANRYLVAIGNGGLMVIDRHRAHVRVLYDRFMKSSPDVPGESQQLLFADTIELTPRQYSTLESIHDQIKSLGYEINILPGNDSGVRRCELNGVPAVLGATDAAEALIKIIEDAGEGVGDASADIRHRLALSLAQSSALRAGQSQTQAEAEHLLSELLSSSDQTYTPDGNSIFQMLPLTEIAKWF